MLSHFYSPHFGHLFSTYLYSLLLGYSFHYKMLFNIASDILNVIERNKCWVPRIDIQAMPANGSPGLHNLTDYMCPKIFIPDPTFPKNASLRILGYTGHAAEEDVKKYVVSQALLGGSNLSCSQSYSNEYRKKTWAKSRGLYISLIFYKFDIHFYLNHKKSSFYFMF